MQIIEKSIPAFAKKDGHPAKRTFQAIRIEVNDEIRPLYETVQKCIKHLKNGGRLCIITFHSLEDRAVKNAYIDAQGKCTCPKDLPYCVCGAKSEGKIINELSINDIKESTAVLFAIDGDVEEVEKIERFIDCEYYEVEEQFIKNDAKSVLQEILSDLN